MARETAVFDDLYYAAPAPEPAVPFEVSVIAHSPSKELQRSGHQAALDEIHTHHEAAMVRNNIPHYKTMLRYGETDDAGQSYRDLLREGEEQLPGLASREADALATYQRAQRVDAVRDKLGRGAFILAFTPGALLGIGTVEGFLHSVDAVAGGVNQDNSIFIGDSLPVVPGVSDLSGTTTRYEVRDGNTVVVKQVTSGDSNATAVNPVAPNFQLTGEEVELDKASLRPVFQFLKDHEGRITSVNVVGLSSDDLSGPGANLGIEDTSGKQQALAELRATAGKQAVLELAAEVGVKVDENTIATSGHEAVLTAEQVAVIDGHAAAAKLSRQELLTKHRRGELAADSNAEADLKSLIDANRGNETVLTAESTTETTRQTGAEIVKLVEDYGTPGEVVAALLAAQLGNISLAFLWSPISGRLARRRARKVMSDPQSAYATKWLDRLPQTATSA